MPHFALFAVVGFQLVFFWWFFSLDLPNADIPGSPGEKFSRGMIWQAAIPGLVPDSQCLVAQAVSKLTVRHLPQRIPLLAGALLIALASLAYGLVVLHGCVLMRGHKDDGLGWDWCTPGEFVTLSFGVGMAVMSLMTLVIGPRGWRVSLLVPGSLLLLRVACELVVAYRGKPSRFLQYPILPSGLSKKAVDVRGWLRKRSLRSVAAGVAVALFLTISFLGAMLPATDFDVREYHLQGPKEFYLAGGVQFLPHNVYTNMPFATEMLSLAGMALAGDWWWGALVGQTVLATFAPMTAVAIWALGRRLFSPAAGAVAAVLYLTTPWVYRIAIIPYTENALCFYLIAATLAAVVALQTAEPIGAGRGWLTAGLLAGAAVSCKYPALVSTAIPLGVAALVAGFLRRGARPANAVRWPVMFACGVAIAWGPWLVKNLYTTGNPVYPLAYELFGGRNWSAEKDAKWDAGHRPPGYSLRQLGQNTLDVVAQSDWQSPLLFAFAPLALAARGHRRAAAWLAGFVAYLFLQWWLFTHRIDRFWVPMLPIVAVLAGAGATWAADRRWQWYATAVVAACVFFNFSYAATALCGYNAYTSELVRGRDPTDEMVNFMNASLPAGSHVLAVGAADLFHLVHRVTYNTVFDDSIFEQLARGRSAADVRLALLGRRVTHVYVHWAEVRRYRETYGFTEFVVPAVFRSLEQEGILVRRLALPAPVQIGSATVPAAELYEVPR